MSPLRVATLVVLCVAVSAGITPDNLHKIYSSMAGIYSTANRTVKDKTASYLSVPVKSHCVCRTMCVTDTRCSAYWVTPSPHGGLGCNLTEGGPFVHVPQPHDGAFYGYKKTDPGQFREDGMIYELVDELVTWSEAVLKCDRKKGYRLGIYKTRTQYEIAMEFYYTPSPKTKFNCINVHLSELRQGEVLWGDETPFAKYESYSSFEYMDNDPVNTQFQLDITRDSISISQGVSLHDRPETFPCRYVCQSDPFNFNLP